jgi:transcriptional antiterminator NusG
MLNTKKDIYAFIPKMESYIRIKDKLELQVMYPGYVFVKTEMNQVEFFLLLQYLGEQRDGIIKELTKKDVSAFTKDEIHLMDQLLDKKGILRMSRGYKDNGKTIVLEGPLVALQDLIIDTDKRDRIAVLDIKILNRNIKAGLFLEAK